MNSELTPFPPITLAQMKGIKLMNRIDTKFVTTVDVLREFLKLAQPYYYVQDMNGKRLMPYHTIYLDTPRLSMYTDHQCGKKHRYKVRMRMYENDGATFLEVKNKSNKGRTKKKRIVIDDLVYDTEEQQDFVGQLTPYAASTLSPVIENRFRRITLVNKDKTERLTIDLELQFHSLLSGDTVQMPNHVIIELKRDGLTPSPALSLLQYLRIKQSGFSKYAIGMALTNKTLRQNNFKERIMYLKKLERRMKIKS